jgi:hypothetical protein
MAATDAEMIPRILTTTTVVISVNTLEFHESIIDESLTGRKTRGQEADSVGTFLFSRLLVKGASQRNERRTHHHGLTDTVNGLSSDDRQSKPDFPDVAGIPFRHRNRTTLLPNGSTSIVDDRPYPLRIDIARDKGEVYGRDWGPIREDKVLQLRHSYLRFPDVLRSAIALAIRVSEVKGKVK